MIGIKLENNNELTEKVHNYTISIDVDIFV